MFHFMCIALGVVLAQLSYAAKPVDTTLQVNDMFKLKVKPSRCIALHRGQMCYQKVKFSWNSPLDKGQYCLYQKTIEKPIVCWIDSDLLEYKLDFQSTKDAVFQVRKTTQDKALAETQVSVSWVYKRKKSKTKNWRVF